MTLRQYSNQMIKIFLAFKMKSTSFSTSTQAKPENPVKGQQKITQCFRKQTPGAPVPYMLQKPSPMAMAVWEQADTAPPCTAAVPQFWGIPLHCSCLRNVIPSSISLTWARKAPQEYPLKSNRTHSRNQGHAGQPCDESSGLGPNSPGKVQVPINQIIRHQCQTQRWRWDWF